MYERGTSFQFVSKFLSGVFYSFKCRSLISLVKFIPKYLTSFDVIVNERVFLVSFLDCTFLLYGSATDFCRLILCSSTINFVFQF